MSRRNATPNSSVYPFGSGVWHRRDVLQGGTHPCRQMRTTAAGTQAAAAANCAAAIFFRCNSGRQTKMLGRHKRYSGHIEIGRLYLSMFLIMDKEKSNVKIIILPLLEALGPVVEIVYDLS